MRDLNFPPRCIITGTDTDVGKTVVSALALLSHQGRYWKPIQCGGSDRKTVQEMTGLGDAHFLPEVYDLARPLSPHLAAKLEGTSISLHDFELPDGDLVVEGAGGVLVPLNDHDLMINLFAKFDLPIVVVARSTLGTINHTLLTLQALCYQDLEIVGVILNGPRNPENRRAIEKYGKVSILGEIEPFKELTPQCLNQFGAP